MGSQPVRFRVVLDTNVVVSALVFGAGRTAWLRLAWRSGAVSPVVSDETVKELVRVLAYPKFELEKDEIDELLADYLPFVEVWSEAVPRSGVQISDFEDLVFVDLALAAKVDMLVSGDRHVAVLRDVDGLEIVDPGGLRRRLEGQ